MNTRQNIFAIIYTSTYFLLIESYETICKKELIFWGFFFEWAPWSNGASDWEKICIIISSIILWLILISYTIVPELQNLQGSIFRCYIATYIATYTIIAAHYFTKDIIVLVEQDMLFYVGLNYCGVSVSLWLNVMSFNIWKTFRAIRSPNFKINNKEREKKKLIYYAIYAWGLPLFISITIAALICRFKLPWNAIRNMRYSLSFVHYTGGGIMALVSICNIFMYISTALKIREQKMDTSNLTVGMNKHQENVEKWFNLYLKLFLIMGGHLIIWIFWIFWSTPFLTSLLATLEMLQSILIFIIFIWKDNVKRSLREQIVKIIYQLLCIFRP